MKKRVSVLEKICYGFGGAADATEMAIVNSFLLLFYTDVIGIPASVAGTMMLACKVFDAVTDVAVVSLTDNTHTKFGRYRPWMLMSIPLGISFILMFWYPEFLQTNMQKIIYCCILYLLTIPIFETSFMCPLYVLAATMSPKESDRVGFVTSRCFGEAVGDVVAASVAMPMILYFGTSYSDIRGWRFMAVAVGVVIMFCGIICFLGIRERIIIPNVDESGKTISFRQKVKVLIGNKPFWRMFLLQTGYDITAMAPIMLFSYFCIHYLGHSEWVSSLMLFATAGQIIVIISSQQLMKKIGKRAMIAASCILTFISWIIVFTSKSYVMMACYNVIRGAPNGLLIVCMGSAWTNISDYTELHYKDATPGFVMSVAQCGNKIGIGVASYIITLALTMIGYQENAAVQSVQTVSSLRTLIIVLPIIGTLLIALMNAKLPEIDYKSIEKVQKELTIIRAKKENNV